MKDRRTHVSLKTLGLVSGVIFLIILGLFLTYSYSTSSQDTIPSKEILSENKNVIEGSSTQSGAENLESVKIECVPDWSCSSWSKCVAPGIKTRWCSDRNKCGQPGNPATVQDCEYTYKIGETVDKNGFRLTLNGVREDFHIGKYYQYLNRYQFEPGEDHKYVIFDLTIENSGYDKSYVSPGYAYLISGKYKTQFEYDYSTSSLDDPFETKDLFPNIEESGEISFELPESVDIKDWKFVYEIDRYNNIYATWDLSESKVTSSVSADCGDTNQICCNDQCSSGNICEDNRCMMCGSNDQSPCEDGCNYGYKESGGKCVISVCNEYADGTTSKDYCYWGYVTGSGDKSYCNLIQDESVRNSCNS